MTKLCFSFLRKGIVLKYRSRVGYRSCENVNACFSPLTKSHKKSQTFHLYCLLYLTKKIRKSKHIINKLRRNMLFVRFFAIKLSSHLLPLVNLKKIFYKDKAPNQNFMCLCQGRIGHDRLILYFTSFSDIIDPLLKSSATKVIKVKKQYPNKRYKRIKKQKLTLIMTLILSTFLVDNITPM
ncbi:T30E16.5 [Arabidopsis thaliana]|uniref:T30E16.5 n=1 Tax=Arabidopsis thaliana TaxID=3702 RepID=Q9LQ66_ARATH|nr:T30E16.5 [Arabidopsis thaliana]